MVDPIRPVNDPTRIRIAYPAPDAPEGTDETATPRPARWFGWGTPLNAGLAAISTAWVVGWAAWIYKTPNAAGTPAEIASLVTAVFGLPAIAWAVLRNPRPRTPTMDENDPRAIVASADRMIATLRNQSREFTSAAETAATNAETLTKRFDEAQQKIRNVFHDVEMTSRSMLQLVGKHADEFKRASTTLTEKTAGIDRMITQRDRGFTELVNKVETETKAICEQLDRQGTVLRELAQTASTQGQEIGAAFARNTDHLSAAMDDTDARSKAVQATLLETEKLVERQAALMRDVTERTSGVMRDMTANLDRHQEYLAAGVDTIATTTAEAGARLEERLDTLRQLAGDTADALAKNSTLAETHVSKLATSVNDLEGRTEAVGSALQQHGERLTGMAGTIEGRLNALGQTMAISTQRLSDETNAALLTGQRLGDTLMTAAGTLQDKAEGVDKAGSSALQRLTVLDRSLTDSRMAMASLTTELETRLGTLHRTLAERTAELEASARRSVDAAGEASARWAERTRELDAASAQAAARVSEAGEAFDRRADALRAAGDTADRTLAEATAAVERQVANLLAAAERAGAAVGRAGSSVATEHDRLNAASAETTQKVDAATTSLRTQVARLETDTQAAIKQLGDLAETLRERQIQIGESEGEASRRLAETRRAVEEAGAALSAVAKAGSDRMNLSTDELKQRAGEIEVVLTSAAERVAGRIQSALVSLAERIEQTDAALHQTETSLTTTLSASVTELARKIQEMQEAGTRANTIIGDARQTLAASAAQLDNSGATARAKVGAVAESVRREAESVLAASVDAAERLEHIAQHFDGRLDALASRLAQVDAGASSAGATLTSRVAILMGASDDIRKKMAELGPAMDEMMSLLEIRLAGAAGHVTTSGEALVSRSDEIAQAITSSLSQLGAAGDAAASRLHHLMSEMASQGERIEVLSHRAEARVATATAGLETQADRVNQAAMGIQRARLMDNADSRERYRSLEQVSRALADETERVMAALRDHQAALAAPPPTPPEPPKVPDEASYLARSGTMIRSLETLSCQIGGKLLPEPHDELRVRFERGDRAAYMRALLVMPASDFRRVYDEKPDLRIAVEMYLHDFETLVGEPAKLGLPNTLNGMFLNSDIGRLYVAFARGSGKI